MTQAPGLLRFGSERRSEKTEQQGERKRSQYHRAPSNFVRAA
jgi:hypothetical protein